MNDMIADSAHIIHEISLNKLGGGVLDITAHARPHHFRFVDCDQFLNSTILRICEYPSLSTIPYSAISYVWRGNPVDLTHPSQWEDKLFSVKGAEGGDPISIDVLRHVCKASLQKSAPYFWLDRLCIMQTHPDDKAWQIAKMQQLYRSAKVCLVLAGGLRRLVSLIEETAWIRRAWTLQEALLPHDVQVLHSWELGEIIGGGTSAEKMLWPSVVEPQQSAMSDLPAVLGGSIYRPSLTLRDGREIKVELSLFGHEALEAVATLTAALSLSAGDADARSQAIWRCSLMRTSSRPVDMVFSIMGLFDVTLDTHAFHRDDRLGATIALAQAILRNGGKPYWLGAALDLIPCPQLSTFPAFPETTVEGDAWLQTRDGKRKIWELTQGSWLKDIPTATNMDDDGYAIMYSRMVRVIGVRAGLLVTKYRAHPCCIFEYDELQPANVAVAGARNESISIPAHDRDPSDDRHSGRTSSHRMQDFKSAFPRRYAMDIGEFACWRQFAPHVEAPTGRALLLEEHAPRKFHRTGWIMYEREDENGLFSKRHKRSRLAVGGPQPRIIERPEEWNQRAEQSGARNSEKPVE